MKRVLITFILLIFIPILFSQTVYYPPLSPLSTWESVSPTSLGWSVSKIDTLYNYLEKQNSKAFIVLKDGKIVLEKYFGTFTSDSLWYWASANKTITSFLIGKAQEEGYLSINEPTNKYLGVGWTTCTAAQENAITIRHQLTMTTGLDDGVTDNHCTSPDCLKFLTAPNSRWAYHNAPYTLLQSVLEKATLTNVNSYTQSTLKAKTGMTGFWSMINYDNVFFSTARSMARYGLLAQHKFIWKTDTLLHDTSYVKSMTTSSQTLNNSYGYLWWLNGKSSYMLPTLQYIFQGSYAPEAPSDMFAALGKNGQILSVSPSQGLVVIRMGNQPNLPAADISPELCNQIWRKLNDAIFNRTAVSEITSDMKDIELVTNSSGNIITVKFPGNCDRLIIFDTSAKPVKILLFPKSPVSIDMSNLSNGVYFLRLKSGENIRRKSFVKK